MFNTVRSSPQLRFSSSPSLSARSLGALATVLLALYAASVLLAGLGSARVLTRHEVLAAEPAREMIAYGHWIIPTFAGQPRLVKPPGMSWLIAASMSLFRSEADWVPRLPSVVAGVAVVLMTAALTAHVLGRSTGIMAGVLAATSHFIILQARLAEADMPLAAMVCAAMTVYILAELKRLQGRQVTQWQVLPFFLFVGLSIPLKGLVGPMFVFSAVITDFIVRREKASLKFLLSPAGWLIFLIIGASWPAAAWSVKHDILAVWKREMFDRFSGDMTGDLETPQPWHFYLYNVPFMLLPWFPLAILGLWDSIRRGWHREAAWKMLAAWVVPGIVILSFSAWKHKHYPIPALPPLVIAAAWGMKLLMAKVRGITRPRSSFAAAAAIVIAAMVGAVVMRHQTNPVLQAAAIEVSVLGIGIAATIIALSRGARRGSFISIAATAWATVAVLHLAILPQLHDDYRDLAHLAENVSTDIDQHEPIYLFGTGETHIAYYLPLRAVRLDPSSKNDLAGSSQFMQQVSATLAKPGVGIAPPDWVDRIAAMTPLRVVYSAIAKKPGEGIDRAGLVYFRFGPNTDTAAASR